MIKWFRVFLHCLRLSVFRPSQDHRMCSTAESGAFCSCGFGNDGVTFDQEMERVVRDMDQNRRK